MASSLYRRYGLSARVRPAPMDSPLVAWRGLVILFWAVVIGGLVCLAMAL
jgi:hypothetical protein